MLEHFNWRRYLVIFLVGAIGDLLFNKYTDSLVNPTGALLGLKNFYATIGTYEAMFWAGLIFVIIYLISDWVYQAIFE